MNILYLADPNSIHDEKWISYFSSNRAHKTFLLPRLCHTKSSYKKTNVFGAILLGSIPDFSIIHFYKTIATAFRIKSIIRKEQIQLIHILYAEPNALWTLFRKFFGIPMIISSRGTDVLKTIPETFHKKTLINYLVAPAYKRAFLNADWVTGTSSTQLKSITSFSNRQTRLSIIRTGVNLETLKERHALPDSILKIKKYILFPRNISPVYNHEFCLKAIKMLPESIKQQYAMVFVGKDNGDLTYQYILEEKMQQMEDVKMVFLSKQKQGELFELYRNAELVVMTPLSDGSPVSAMESLLCGTRLVLGPLEYDDEIFSEGVIRMKQWDIAELAESIQISLSQSLPRVELSPQTMDMMSTYSNMTKLESLYKMVLPTSVL